MPKLRIGLSRLPSGLPLGCLNQECLPLRGVTTPGALVREALCLANSCSTATTPSGPPCRSPSITTWPDLARSIPGNASGHSAHHCLICSSSVVDSLRHFTNGYLSSGLHGKT